MTVALDMVRRVGEVAIAAVVEQKVQAFCSVGALSFRGTKRPLAILIRRAGMTWAFDAAGQPISLHTFDCFYPGQRARFERQAGAPGDPDDGK